jgi:hypothetical protein
MRDKLRKNKIIKTKVNIQQQLNQVFYNHTALNKHIPKPEEWNLRDKESMNTI